MCCRSLAGKAVSKPAATGRAIGFECFVCQLEVSAAGRSLVQRSPTEYKCVCVVMIRRNNNVLLLRLQ